MERSSGVLMHISSLPGEFGIGTFGKEAYNFVDFLEKSGQKYWQLLPLGPTGFGDAPYSSFSAFAGNKFFIDFNQLAEEGLLEKKDFEGIDFGNNIEKVDYEKVNEMHDKILRLSYERNYNRLEDVIKTFCNENTNWIEDYALFMALKKENNLRGWKEWNIDIKSRKPEVLNYWKNELQDEIKYIYYVQYLFFEQWIKLRKYANEKGIKVIGDIPIYVAEDSADAWVNSDIFELDEDRNPINIAGCPPDGFSVTGQLWGNPLYKWDVLEERNFDWWVERIAANYKMFDVIRIDHFKGLESYWSVPYEDDSAINGKWMIGPGEKLFNAIKEELGELNIIAEDLGFLTQETIDLRNNLELPGMKILIFGFYSQSGDDMFLPHNYENNFIAYTGTHDNETVMGWIKSTDPEVVDYAFDYLGIDKNKTEEYHWEFVRAAWSSVADLAIAPMQDLLGLDNSARMNIPSTIGGNWEWRVKKEDLSDELAKKINKITRIYGR